MDASTAACRLSIEGMFESVVPGHRSYLWTFTFALPTAREVGRAWNRFLRSLQRRKITFAGVRVFEKHPGIDGESHGMHVHVACNRWHDVERIKAVWAKYSQGGRVHVRAMSLTDGRKQAGYLSKYVGKGVGGKSRLHWLRGLRLWARIRCAGVLVKNVRRISPRSAFTRWALHNTDTVFEMLLRRPVPSHIRANAAWHRSWLGVAGNVTQYRMLYAIDYLWTSWGDHCCAAYQAATGEALPGLTVLL